MESPPTSSIAFLDLAGNRIDGPKEWMRAQVEVRVSQHDWETKSIRLVRQDAEELLLAQRRLSMGEPLRIVADWPLSGTGHYRLRLYDGDTQIDEIPITITPRKISEAAYVQMLEDLETRLPAAIALGLQRNGAYAGLKILPPGASTLATELTRLNRAITGSSTRIGLAQVLNDLAADPHQVLHSTKLWVPRERARRPHPSDLVQAMSRPSNMDKQGLPIELLDTRVEHSVDVYENRLVKTFLYQVDLRLRRLSFIFERSSNSAPFEEARKLRTTLDHARRKARFLNDVTLPAYLPVQTTMVILKRPAYHAALQGYLEFHQSPGIYLKESALDRPLENLPFLYQVWGILEVLSVLLDLTGELGYTVISQQLAKRDASAIFIRMLPDGKPLLILKQPTTGTVIKVIPERTYSTVGEFRSISFAQIPDIAIEIFPAQDAPYLYLFDPKYKLDSDWQVNGSGNGTPKKEDIDKMHAYRDAIRDAEHRRVVHYAAILYPGSPQRYTAGLEALQALPDSRTVLEERLREILTNALRR